MPYSLHYLSRLKEDLTFGNQKYSFFLEIVMGTRICTKITIPDGSWGYLSEKLEEETQLLKNITRNYPKDKVTLQN